MNTTDKLAEALRLAREWFRHEEAGEGPQADDVIKAADEAITAHDAEQEPCHDAWRAALAQRREPLTDAQIEQGRRETFSTENPFCPCTDKTMRKAVRWAERACAEAWGVKLGATPGEQR